MTWPEINSPRLLRDSSTIVEIVPSARKSPVASSEGAWFSATEALASGRVAANEGPASGAEADSRIGAGASCAASRRSVVSGNNYLGLAGYVTHSQVLHTRSASPAAIAGVRGRQ